MSSNLPNAHPHNELCDGCNDRPFETRLQVLQELQMQHTELEKQFHLEALELEKKFALLYEPIYQRRAQLVDGANILPQELPTSVVNGVGDEVIVRDAEIPNFWLTVLTNHVEIGELITPRDHGALSHLQDIKIQYTMDRPGYVIMFCFKENEWFEDHILTKTYYYQQTEYVGDLVYAEAIGCDIHWKPGNDLTVEVITKKQRHKGTRQTRVITSTVPAETFFNYFKALTLEDVATDSDYDDSDEEELLSRKRSMLSDRQEEDYELGEEFKEKLVPHAVDWYTGKALEYEGLELDDDDSSEDEETTTSDSDSSG